MVPALKAAPLEANDGNCRRSKRQRFRPLDYWKNERVVYAPTDRRGSARFERIVDVIVAEPSPEPVHKRRAPKAQPQPAAADNGETLPAAEVTRMPPPLEPPPLEGGIISGSEDLDNEGEGPEGSAVEGSAAPLAAPSYRLAAKKKARKA